MFRNTVTLSGKTEVKEQKAYSCLCGSNIQYKGGNYDCFYLKEDSFINIFQILRNNDFRSLCIKLREDVISATYVLLYQHSL